MGTITMNHKAAEVLPAEYYCLLVGGLLGVGYTTTTSSIQYEVRRWITKKPSSSFFSRHRIGVLFILFALPFMYLVSSIQYIVLLALARLPQVTLNPFSLSAYNTLFYLYTARKNLRFVRCSVPESVTASDGSCSYGPYSGTP